jgi:hypothetical protein
VRTALVAKDVPAGDLASRRAILRWTWAMLMTLSFLADVRPQHARCRGVLLYDLHLLDVLVQLDLVYGRVNLRLHRAMMRRVLPTAECVSIDPPIRAPGFLSERGAVWESWRPVRNPLEPEGSTFTNIATKPQLSVSLTVPAEVALSRKLEREGRRTYILSIMSSADNSRAMKPDAVRSKTFVGWMEATLRRSSPR